MANYLLGKKFWKLGVQILNGFGEYIVCGSASSTGKRYRVRFSLNGADWGSDGNVYQVARRRHTATSGVGGKATKQAITANGGGGRGRSESGSESEIGSGSEGDEIVDQSDEEDVQGGRDQELGDGDVVHRASNQVAEHLTDDDIQFEDVLVKLHGQRSFSQVPIPVV